MDPAVLIELLNQNNPSDFKDFKQLDRLLKNHPYFQIGLAAKSKYLKAKQHIDYIKISRKTAAIFPNRPKLHNYLNQPEKNSRDPIERENAPSKELLITNLPRIKQEIKPILHIKEKTEILTKDAPISELEKNYLAEAINKSIQLDATGYAIEDFSKVEEEPKMVDKEILSFSDWLGGTSKIGHRRFQDNLIESFISEDPIITKVKKKDFYSPIEKGKESISDLNLPVSETLARIFADQGNKEMAKKGYEKLILKYPEKSAYFAGLIKKLIER